CRSTVPIPGPSGLETTEMCPSLPAWFPTAGSCWLEHAANAPAPKPTPMIAISPRSHQLAMKALP
ncbi:MAG TPA: hypothetical protein VN032_03270, partial [Thermoanaerobaculia bacterium]|nr:hypothetical protein [Thermoanaerobaculia bacterium]